MNIIILLLIVFIIIHMKHSDKTNSTSMILQLSNPTKETLENTLNKKLPTVITDVIQYWDIIKDLTPEYIKSYYPDYKVKLHTTIPEQESTNIIVNTMEDFINWIQTVDNVQTQNLSNVYMSEDFSFLKETKLDKYLEKYTELIHAPMSFVKSYFFWMGPKGTRTGLHYDTDYRNILCQIYGRKRIILFNPSQTKYMYPSKKFDNGALLSKIDFWNPDLGRFPKFRKAKYIEIILHPGQMLYIPPYWWHAVENLDTNIAISVRTENIFSSLNKVPNLLKTTLHYSGLYKKGNCVCHN